MFDGPKMIAGPALQQRPLRPAAWTSATTVVLAAWRRQRSRKAIAGLDAFLLKDIGVSYAEAEAEANKPCWLP